MSASLRALRIALVCALVATQAGAGEEAGIRNFPLGAVRLLDSPFKQAADRNAEYLLSLDADRLLHNTRQYAGLEPRGELYGGWEARGIAGHTLGHYLSALSRQFAASGDARFRERVDYIVSEMAVAQEAYGDGYVGALPPLELETLRRLKDGHVAVENPFVFEGGAWVPWYTEHKVLAGLRDAWVIAGNEQAKGVTLALADWIYDVTANLDEAELQTMLEVEHGGMSGVLADLYERTRERRYLEASGRFRHRAILDPLREHRDELVGLHANTQIPKVLGAARSYEVSGDTGDREIARYFWDEVVHRHSWVIGGNSDGEHFFEPDTAASHLGAATAETCNTYNMLELTNHLLRWEPRVEYADYYERALYNHILASQETEHGMYAYFMSLEPGHFRTYSTPHDSFWCCVGTGMENHTQYGRDIYTHDDDQLFVNLYIPSVLTWAEQGLVLEQQTHYPARNTTTLQFRTVSDRPLALRIRAPGWAASPLTFSLNGKQLVTDAAPGQYASIERVWRRGDRLVATIPMSARTETLRGSKDRVALLYGPVVLAGDLGPAPRGDTFPYAEDQAANLEAPNVPVPALVGTPSAVLENLSRRPGAGLAFTAAGLLAGKPVDVTLRPFAELPYARYNVYWTLAQD